MIKRAALLAVALVVLGSVPAEGTGDTVSLPVVEGEIRHFVISRDSSWVVYQTASSSEEIGLYSVPTDGRSPIELHRGWALWDTIVLSQDSLSVFYLVNDDSHQPLELYSVNIAGGTPTKFADGIDWGITERGQSSSIAVSADSAHVVYEAFADAALSADKGVYSAPVGGGSPVRLSGSLLVPVRESAVLPGSYVFAVSPDSSRVVFYAREDADRPFEVYSVPIDGGAPVGLGEMGLFQISADSSRVVYQVESDSVTDLYSVPIGGGTPVKLNSPLSPWSRASSFVVSEDSSRVVYEVEHDSEALSELFSVPIEGGAPVRLDASHLAGHYAGDGFEVSADSSRVVYEMATDASGTIGLFSQPIDGGAPTRLSGELVPKRWGFWSRVSPDSSRVVFVVRAEDATIADLYSVPIQGGTPTKLNTPLSPGGEVYHYDFVVTDDSSTVVYQADHDADNVLRLFAVPIDGGTSVQLSDAMRQIGGMDDLDPLEFAVAPDSWRVVFRGAEVGSDVRQLYLSTLSRFIDVAARHRFSSDIGWLADQGITRGCDPPANKRFCPDDPVTRGQMAAFLNRALDLPSTGVDFFVDDDGSIFEADINRLAAAGITKGCNPPDNDEFCPGGSVTRGQMAAFLVRAFGYTDPGSGDLFTDDDGSTFEADIDRLATAGVTKGCNPPGNTRFCPDRAVTRAEMAAFLHRALN